ncbi:hypothetical protein UA08_04374 [Talaromyces atroroseus]|uniref:NADP-dependent oxidoreductase domain-containing protein n=1 Tax=Talaromyces atroroseus TaxID=1441469 RepID=A0A1Q5Q8H3_TALAT|nr:hypothetical protein UA08_04374 [Talaromyces atroroseus]OKL60411.1 hypothetical protein UA08_04374 [Talaromyces atroroseus]
MASLPRFQGIPDILYGTAFKFEQSASLVSEALKAGFRAIDTAGSRTAYQEDLVGNAIDSAITSGHVKRHELYIQTKFSPFKAGKDPALYPYDTAKSISEQVEESVASSLANLRTTYIDCLVLHSLYQDIQNTLIAWKAMEALVPSKVASLGVSNCDLESLRQLWEAADIKPVVVQNRFTEDIAGRPNPAMPPNLPYPLVSFDRDVREYCGTHGIVYAPWGLLWGNPSVLDDPKQILETAGQEIGVSKQILLYAIMRSIGGCEMSILCGTTKVAKMHETLEGLTKIKSYIAESDIQRKRWEDYARSIRDIIC